ncbi:MAG: hypothetical protein MJ095_07065 [Oscillospiraceae bacterium]|nr:hypothetical protein [Oscillospiraceae bacterium]
MKQRKNMQRTLLTASAFALALTAASCGAAEENIAETAEEKTVSVTEAAAVTTEAVTQTEEVTVTVSETTVTTEAVTDASGISQTVYEEDSWENFVAEYYSQLNNLNIRETVKLMYPKDVFDRLDSAGRLTDEKIESFFPKDINDDRYELTALSVADDAEQDTDIQEAMKMFGRVFDLAIESIELSEKYENDPEKVPDEERDALYSALENIDDYTAEPVHKVTEMHEIKAEFNKNGEPDYEYLYVIKIKDHGWVIQPSMRKFTEKFLERANADR